MSALAELLGIDEARAGDERRAIALQAGDRPALPAAWIEELAFLAESEVLAGRPGAMERSFGTTCHGAGRQMSRTAVRKAIDMVKG